MITEIIHIHSPSDTVIVLKEDVPADVWEGLRRMAQMPNGFVEIAITSVSVQ